MEADCVLTNQAERFERELQEATDPLEELVASSGMDTACRDALEPLVYTDQSPKSTEAEFEDTYAAGIDAVNSILLKAPSSKSIPANLRLDITYKGCYDTKRLHQQHRCARRM